jgi:hypothetical protein
MALPVLRGWWADAVARAEKVVFDMAGLLTGQPPHAQRVHRESNRFGLS